MSDALQTLVNYSGRVYVRRLIESPGDCYVFPITGKVLHDVREESNEELRVRITEDLQKEEKDV